MSGTADFGLSRIGQISLRVYDVDRAVAFYPYRPGMARFSCTQIKRR